MLTKSQSPANSSHQEPSASCHTQLAFTTLPHGHARYESQSGIQYFPVQRSTQWGKRFTEDLSAAARVGDRDRGLLL